MSQSGLKVESLRHLGQRRFLRSAQHHGRVHHQAQQGRTILEAGRERRREEARGGGGRREGGGEKQKKGKIERQTTRDIK